MIDPISLLPFGEYVSPLIRNWITRPVARRNGWAFKAWPSMRLVGEFVGIARRDHSRRDECEVVNEMTCRIDRAEMHLLTIAAFRSTSRSRYISNTWTACVVQDPQLQLPSAKFESQPTADACRSLSGFFGTPVDELRRLLETPEGGNVTELQEASAIFRGQLPRISFLGNKLALDVNGWPLRRKLTALACVSRQVYYATRTVCDRRSA